MKHACLSLSVSFLIFKVNGFNYFMLSVHVFQMFDVLFTSNVSEITKIILRELILSLFPLKKIILSLSS
jgi:hypothetical protein